MTILTLRDLGFVGAAGGYAPIDENALAYITAVEAADGQTLEPAVRKSIDEFVIGCKADGIWNAIKASCILAGARTLSGALVPLVGTAPTNFNFVAGDYNSKTGLVGNGSTKYLNSNVRLDSINAAAYTHCACSTSSISVAGYLMYVDTQTRLSGQQARIRNSSVNQVFAAGFLGMSLPSGSGLVVKNNNTDYQGTGALSAVPSGNVLIFGTSGAYANSRISSYFIGDSLDLTLLGARVTTLINAFAAAIP